MLRNLQKDLQHLSTLAFRRSAHCAPLLQKFHTLKKQIAATGHPDLTWNIYDWLLVPLSLWPLDFEGFSHHLLESFSSSASSSSSGSSSSSIQNQNSKFKNSSASSPSSTSTPDTRHSDPLPDSLIHLLKLIDPPPPASTQSVVSSFEHDVESGRYEKMLKQAAKFDEQEKALLQNQQLAAEWAELKRLFSIKQFQNARGVIRRRMSQERGFRDPTWQFPRPTGPKRSEGGSCNLTSCNLHPLSAGGEGQGEVVPSFKNQKSQITNLPGFHFFFDAFCYRWKLYGMEHDRPLLLKISVNPTPHGTMIVIPRHWSLDPRRDLDWSLINRLHRSRGAKKQGPKLSSARIEKLDDAKKVRAAWQAARTKGLKGDRLHDFICQATRRDARSDPSWWKRLLRK
jgi:hypothetical protein